MYGCVEVSQSSGSSKANCALVVVLLFAHERSPPRLLVPPKHSTVGLLVAGMLHPAPPVALLQLAAGMIFTSGKSMALTVLSVLPATMIWFVAAAFPVVLVTTFVAAIPESDVVLSLAAALTRLPLV